MADNVALGIANDGDVGTSPLAMRKCIRSLWRNPGVVDGLAVTGNSGLTYSVAAGICVCSRNAGGGDGFSWAVWDGGATDAVAGNAGSYPRIDVVWLRAYDRQQGDPDNLVHVGVTQGSPAASPVAPAAPSNATVLAHMLVPAGATSTAAATSRDARRFWAVPYGSSMGVLLDKTYTATKELLKAYVEKPVAQGSVVLPTARTLSIGLTVSVQAANCAAATPDDGSGYAQLWVDGAKARTYRFDCHPWSPTCLYFEDVRRLEAGSHTLKMSVWGSTTKPASDLYLCYGGDNNWPGQRLTVTDLGVAAS